MISLMNKVDLAEEVFAELRREKITETAALARLEVKIEQIKRDMQKFSALLCVTCDEIGRPEKPTVAIDFGPVVDDE